MTSEIIRAAVEYVRNVYKAKKKSGTPVYRNVDGLTVSAEFVKVIIDRVWLCGNVSPTSIVIFLYLLALNIYVFGSNRF